MELVPEQHQRIIGQAITGYEAALQEMERSKKAFQVACRAEEEARNNLATHLKTSGVVVVDDVTYRYDPTEKVVRATCIRIPKDLSTKN